MDEVTVFEQRLEARLRTFALAGVRPVDSAAVAHAVAVEEPRGRGTGASLRWRGLRLGRRTASIALAVGLLVALLGGALLVGARLLPTPSSLQPPHTHAVIAGGPGLVAVGAQDAFDDMADIWTSSDGRTWSRVTGQELGPGVIHDVTCGGPGLVAVGKGSRGGAVWTSRDGLTWSRAPDDPVFGARGWIHAVTVGGPRLVAVGFPHGAWFSSDGLTWTRATLPPVPPDVYPGDDGQMPQVYLNDVAAAGDHLVAVGGMTMNDSSQSAVVWTSGDGMTWTDVPLDPEVFPPGNYLGEVTGGPDGLIAIGADALGGPSSMWTSPDGLRWRRADATTALPTPPDPSPTPAACP
jgi:hypothetical protein